MINPRRLLLPILEVASATRRKYIPVGSSAPSLAHTVASPTSRMGSKLYCAVKNTVVRT